MVTAARYGIRRRLRHPSRPDRRGLHL